MTPLVIQNWGVVSTILDRVREQFSTFQRILNCLLQVSYFRHVQFVLDVVKQLNVFVMVQTSQIVNFHGGPVLGSGDLLHSRTETTHPCNEKLNHIRVPAEQHVSGCFFRRPRVSSLTKLFLPPPFRNPCASPRTDMLLLYHRTFEAPHLHANVGAEAPLAPSFSFFNLGLFWVSSPKWNKVHPALGSLPCLRGSPPIDILFLGVFGVHPDLGTGWVTPNMLGVHPELGTKRSGLN